MNAAFLFKLYLPAVPVFVPVDMFRISYAARNVYKNQFHSLLSPQIKWATAFLFYFIYIAGILLFTIHPDPETGRFGWIDL